MRLRVYSDPGHGWLAVPLELLDCMGLVDQVSGFSYIRGSLAYLEEDCDALLFLAAAKGAALPVTLEEVNCRSRQSRIRNYPHYSPERAKGNLENGRQWRPAYKPPLALRTKSPL